METSESLPAGIICPSISPVGAISFLWARKMGHSIVASRTLMKLKKYLCHSSIPPFNRFRGNHHHKLQNVQDAHPFAKIRKGANGRLRLTCHLCTSSTSLCSSTPRHLPGLGECPLGLHYPVCLVYLYDILIFSHKLQEHHQHVRQILWPLLENKLFVKDMKCEFHIPFVTFLDYIIDRGQVDSNSDKVKAVNECPILLS